jgi:tetratricopeptide (TPR) repeat protein
MDMRNDSAAIPHLKYVADMQTSEFKEDALLKLSLIYRKNNDCVNGLPYYEQLEKSSTTQNTSKFAIYSQMVCLDTIGQKEKAKIKAEQLLKYDPLNNMEKGKANNVIAHYYLHDSLYNVAKVYFARTLKNQQDEFAAEAKYYEAFIYYMQDSLDKCKKSIGQFSNQFSGFDYWLDKTFILLADYYLKKGDVFQAKATLNSILEGSKDEEIRTIARQKLEALEPAKKQSEEDGE